MKRFSKLKNKKGFTLLETLLATCILVIIGSMLMEGFITAMGYSYNSSVYARSASFNNKLCVDKLAYWSMKADGVASVSGTGTINPEDAPYKEVGQYGYDQTTSLTVPKTLTFNTLGTIRIAVYDQKNVNNDYVASDKMIQSGSNLNRFTAEKIRNNDNAVADNRTIFFYYPTNNGTPGDSYFGKTHVYIKNGTTWVWGYEDPSDPSAIDGVVVIGNRTPLSAEN